MVLEFGRLEGIGFGQFFRSQLSLDEIGGSRIARVITLDRRRLTLFDGDREWIAAVPGRMMDQPPEERPTVGDWLVLDPTGERIERVLERKSLFKRMAAGVKVDIQLIAANVDTLLIVASCNADFNASRLERYLALALDAGTTPVIVLTKADQTDDAEWFRAQAERTRRGTAVEVVNALDPATLDGVRTWCTRGQTLALVGSSGVGKSTLANSLAGEEVADTNEIRASDERGRHTTTRRALHFLPSGAALVDSPGMRELRLADAEAGVEEVFDDVESIVQRCRFVDCGHDTEPDCAIRAALETGALDERRYQNYLKLLREQRHAKESIAERNARGRKFAKMVKARMKDYHKPR
jgi:ribosome biogenesis GTPase